MRRARNCGCRCCAVTTSDAGSVVAVPPITSTSSLHVHHICPHGMGGLTELGNLVTLCHTCHGGLDPHYEARLLSMVPGTASSMAADLCLSGYEEGRRLYRQLSAPGSPLACGVPAA